MSAIGTRYIVNDKGRKTAVLLNLKEYKQLIARVEELEDALELDNAVHNATGFRNYKDIRKDLEKEGRC